MKKIFSVFICITLILSFVGCSSKVEKVGQGSQSSNNVGEKEKKETNKEVVELTLWHYNGDTSSANAINDIVARFNTEYEEINVTSEYVPRDELMKQYTIGLVGDNLPDIGMIDNPDHAAFIEMGLFQDITELVKEWGEIDEFFEGPLKSTMKGDRIYGLPQNSNCLAFWYDVDLFEKASLQPPTTWDELKVAAEKLTEGDTYGLAISAVKNEEGTFQYLPWLLATGADVENLDSPESIEALTYLTDMIKDGHMSPEVINWTQADVEKQFASGKAAMMVNGPWNIDTVKKDAPDKNWAVTKIPMDAKYASVLGGENIGIINGLEEKKLNASWEFLKYISSEEVSREFNEKANKFSPRSDSTNGSDYWSKDEVLSVFADQLQYAMPRGPHPRWSDISKAICVSFQKAYTDYTTPEQACKEAQDSVEKALSK